MTSSPPISDPQPALYTSAWQRHFAATRPAFLTLTIALIFPGLASAPLKFADKWAIILGFIAALLLHAAANVINDVADHDNSSDAHNYQRLYPFTGGSRFIQNHIMSRQAMLRLARILFLTAVAIGGLLAWHSGWPVIVFGGVGIFLGWAYSMPPLRLNSRGWGEFCVWLGFGLIPIGTAFVAYHSLPLQIWIIGIICACFTLALLHINQFPDRAADAYANKRHWVVRLSPHLAAQTHFWLIITGYTVLFAGIFFGVLPLTALISATLLPLSLYAARQLTLHAARPQALRSAIIATLFTAHLIPFTLAIALWGQRQLERLL